MLNDCSPILVTIGEPCGIGPDLVPFILNESYSHPIVIVGEQKHINVTLPLLEHKQLENPQHLPKFSLLEPLNRLKSPSFTYVDLALSVLEKKSALALVTGPIEKKEWIEAGFDFKGHTELFQTRFPTDQLIMFFWSPGMKVALYSVHCPLQLVPSLLTRDKIVSFIDSLIKSLGNRFSSPYRIVVAGLNPHAGEASIMGGEEDQIIKPALDEVRRLHAIRVDGPLSADSLFHEIKDKKDVVVVAWYHDQGLIPFKLLNFFTGVNVTLGLPFIRTSPDHGTAAHLKGTSHINPTSMLSAVRLADQWVSGSTEMWHI